jgi:hypothetical protein
MTKEALPEWDDHFTVVPNPNPDENDSLYWRAEDLEEHNIPLNRTWTVVDSDESEDLLIISGVHHYNRIDFAVSVESWTVEGRELLWSEGADAEDWDEDSVFLDVDPDEDEDL